MAVLHLQVLENEKEKILLQSEIQGYHHHLEKKEKKEAEKQKISSSMAREIDFLQEHLKQKEGNYCHHKIKVLTVTL